MSDADKKSNLADFNVDEFMLPCTVAGLLQF